MRYFKIYTKAVRTIKPFHELSRGEFDVEVGDYAAQNSSWIEDEDGDADYEAMDREMSEIVERIEAEAKKESGFYMGDYYLYIRSDDVELLDMSRPNA